jgi:serine/threonine protein phosphatase PrpC
MRFAVDSFTSAGPRSENQDSVGVRQFGASNLVAVVADGLGLQHASCPDFIRASINLHKNLAKKMDRRGGFCKDALRASARR